MIFEREMYYTKKFSIHKIISFFIGVLVPFPFEIMPGFYFSYFTSIIILFYLKFDFRVLIFLLLFFISVFISFFFNGLNGSALSIFVTLYTSIFLVASVCDKFEVFYFLRGLKLSVFFVFILFIIAFIFEDKSNFYYLFISNRTWANEFIPFSGNGLAMLMVCLVIIFNRFCFFSILSTLIAILTTSRLSLLAFPIMFSKKKYGLIIYVLIFLSIFVVFYFFNDTAYFQRLMKFDDRFVVYSESINTIWHNSLFGVGPVDFGEYRHSHNSFLYVFSRYGVFAFFAYIVLVLYLFVRLYKALGLFVLFVILAMGLFQIGYQNIALVIIFPILFKDGIRGGYSVRS